MRGPGLFFIVPFVDRISAFIDQRVVTTAFAAEQTLTADTVPVNVDAVLFWMVHDPEKAALEVQDYQEAVSWAAQTALRDIIGRTSLTDLLRGRERIEADLQTLIDARSTPWGVTVQSVEMRDIVIPGVAAGRDVARGPGGARKAGARHPGPGGGGDCEELRGRGRVVRDNPTALHLRAMNMLYEGLKEKGALMLIPELGRRVDGHGRPDGIGRSHAEDDHGRRRGRQGLRREPAVAGDLTSAWRSSGGRR